MKPQEIYQYIDHTLLKPTSTWDEIKEVCKQAQDYKTASACIPPYYVAYAKKEFPTLNICTVIGFPLGYTYPEIKANEAKEALSHGAGEIDMVANICAYFRQRGKTLFDILD
ncbi:MAG: 2-deoxyribose-5-phosphate aldolase, partial [Bifidobacteriaceae bacterium]|nr:2-deoxyribose-5-phosphate aldolase [Bifidobacteriaceae bacterium]